MNKLIFKAVPILVFELTVQTIFAQGTLYVSNLGKTVTGSAEIGSDSWIAQSFVAGSNSRGYVLNSVQLLMDSASGRPGNFSVSIYSTFGNGFVLGSSLGTLVGSISPTTPGTYTYTASGITLLPFNGYFVVVTSATPIAQGAYDWSATSGGTQGSIDPRFLIENFYYSSVDGSSWNSTAGQGAFQLGIYATAITAVPEPSAWSLILLGGGVLICVRTRKHLSA